MYIGASAFGARHAAGNTVGDIAELCRYAHRYGARVYATVNTVVYDAELDEALRLLGQLNEAGVDAVLVQDMGLYDTARHSESLANMVWHASTQTDNRTTEKVRWLRDIGFERVVLARETRIEDIAAIHRAVPDVELEAFVHGALCVSLSGQCYASEACLGRSANRGECAQMCRMKYSLIDADGKKVAPDAYWLSLKDQCQVGNIERMVRAGVTSLKIEGRLKDVAYVKNVVAAYSRRLDEAIAHVNAEQAAGHEPLTRSSWGRVELAFEPDLRRTFNRGYTTYCADGREPEIASVQTPKAIGEPVGIVRDVRRGRQASLSLTAATATIAGGDGLCFFNAESGALEGFRVNRVEFGRLYPLAMPTGLTPGTRLYRNQDHAFDQTLAGSTARRVVPIAMHVKDCGDSLRLTISGPAMSGEAALPLAMRQVAEKPQTDNIRRQLTRLGGTIYECERIDIAASLDRVFIPSSQLADLRRRAVEAITLTATPSTLASSTAYAPFPHDEYYTKHPSLYNATNRAARDFYARCGVSTAQGFERNAAASPGTPLMRCHHCLRYALGHCVRHGGRRPAWHEPLSLRLADGTAFRLDFDCKNCIMNLKTLPPYSLP